ncbi:bark storage protein A-like [Aristolochia californica]|uniref:bark storage protein A-like n=1 Tax=Aristolochia californica TaxID=171875 RepID=UPI0035E23E71
MGPGAEICRKPPFFALVCCFYYLLLLASALPVTHPLREVVEEVNADGPFVGVVMAYEAEERALFDSGFFRPRRRLPWMDLSGRRFHVGTISDVDVICVMSGQRRLNAGVTVQILIDVFDLRGIVHYGTAGSSNDSLSFGDVSVPKYIAFTGSWAWMKLNSDKAELPELTIGAYNIPAAGKNFLSRVQFKPEEFYSVGRSMEEVFWLEPDASWYQLAGTLRDLKLQQCENATYCLPETPKVVFGHRGSTADIFVDNAAYRDFLLNTFNVSTVDEESAAIVMTARSNRVPSIVFRGVSDLAGGGSTWSSTSLSSLASINALTVAVEFISLISKAAPAL